MKKTIVANWKMNTTLAEAKSLSRIVARGLKKLSRRDVILCPPFVWLEAVSEVLKKENKQVKLAAQNVFFADKGSFTGEISPVMIKELCQFVIIGHSERRRFLQENDEMINKKVHAALNNNLIPIVCVGEFEKTEGLPNPEIVSDNQTYGSIFHQLSQSLVGVSKEDIKKTIIAYEPVWAIGTGNPASPEYAKRTIGSLRDRLTIIYDRETACKIKILYGGSVDANNSQEFLREEQIDGILVGGASLKAEEFVKICKR